MTGRRRNQSNVCLSWIYFSISFLKLAFVRTTVRHIRTVPHEADLSSDHRESWVWSGWELHNLHFLYHGSAGTQIMEYFTNHRAEEWATDTYRRCIVGLWLSKQWLLYFLNVLLPLFRVLKRTQYVLGAARSAISRLWFRAASSCT